MVRQLPAAAGLIPPARCAAELPHELSGAQCQPVVTAGALACDAGLIILREPVLMLDVSRRAGMLRLLARLPEDRWLSLLCITHDLLSVWLVNENLLLSKGKSPGSARRSSPSLPVRGLRVRLCEAVANPCAAAGGQPSHTT
jgi:ABC-type dipeptide/oligopeptide/nickel transport system ATPase component